MIGRKLGAAAVILDTQGRVLLVKHTYGPLNWELRSRHAPLCVPVSITG